ncbi:hypothetical protein F5883DRAFT_588857, partial [Diaporthe sp. PMI_573]
MSAWIYCSSGDACQSTWKVGGTHDSRNCEKRRKKLIDGKHILGIGGQLVDKLLRDAGNAKAKQETQPKEHEEIYQDPHDRHCGCPRCKAPPQPVVDNRPLQDREVYKKVGDDYYPRSENTWIPSFGPEQYCALPDIHRILSHEHCDFFAESQHPNASLALEFCK